MLRGLRTTLDEPGGVREMVGEVAAQAQVPELDEAIEAGVLSVSFDFMTLGVDTDTQIREQGHTSRCCWRAQTCAASEDVPSAQP